MVARKKLKLKPNVLKFIKLIGIIIGVGLVIFLFYRYQISTITKLGYSEVASKNILFSLKKDYVINVGSNKTLNAAFESNFYKEKYLDNYSKIKYQPQKNIIKNINTLLEKGYTNNDISIILAHGNDKDVSDFSKRDKIKYLEEFYSVSYAKLRNYDRYMAYSDETGEDEETTVLYVNLNLDKTAYEDSEKVSDFSTDMLVNKYRYLEEDFIPNDLVKIDKDYSSSKGMKASKVAVDAFVEMSKAAKKENLGLVINSAYRSFEDQNEIIDTYRNLYGEGYINKYVAKTGYSEHQTGLAFDIGSTSSKVFANSKEYKWMLENAYKYGFILRFPKKYENITGFRNEPWHYRYVGKKISKYIYENNITLEEYYAMFLDR